MTIPRKTVPNEPNDEVVAIQDDQRDLGQNDSASHVPATSGAATLLPRRVASFVSFVTQSTSLSLRLGTFFGGFALDGARATTLTGLELSRAMIEGILTRAGRDVAVKSGGDRGKMEAETLLERSVSNIQVLLEVMGLIWRSWLLCIRRLLQPRSLPRLLFISHQQRCHPFPICPRLCYLPLMRYWARQSPLGQ